MGARVSNKAAEELRKADPAAYALATKRGVNVINGGRARMLSEHLRLAYEIHLRKMRRRNPLAKLGRYTAPKAAKTVEPLSPDNTRGLNRAQRRAMERGR